MKTNLFVTMIFLSSFFKAQSACNYIEINPKSDGYHCKKSILFFSNSVDTVVEGSISAEDQILITPSSGYSILILPTNPCTNCTEPDTTSPTIGTKKGGGKGRIEYSNKLPSDKKQEITIEKNPVENLLKISLRNSLIKSIKIYSILGKEILSKNIHTNEIEIDVSRFQTGIYWVKTITDDNQTYTKQFLKK